MNINREKSVVVKKIILGIAFLSLSNLLISQKGWEAGGWLGVSYYFGDLNTSFDLGLPGMSGGLVARYNINNRLAVKFSASAGFVSADDARSNNAFERSRNLSFSSSLLDLSSSFEFNFLPYNHGSDEDFFTPYIFAGFSVFQFNPTAELDGDEIGLRDLGTEGQFKGEEYLLVQPALNYGIGFKLDLTYEWSLNFEISARSLFTDYLDDVSTVYADKDDLLKLRGETAVALSDRSIEIPGVEGNSIGEEGRQRGNSNNNDSYVFLGVGLVYYFGDIRCPEYGRR